MQATFLLGPAGSGKTHRCLEEIRADLQASPDGLPLVLLAPKQATFQLERQLLASLPGYTRLQILSFERLANFILAEFAVSPPNFLDEEGRVMVLRALLAQKEQELKIFRATARLPGFARQLSLLLRELQRHQQSPEKLVALAARIKSSPELDGKLRDLSVLLGAYLGWLKEHQLQDANCLLDLATEALGAKHRATGRSVVSCQSSVAGSPDHGQPTTDHSALHFGGLWLDGFAEMTPQELDFLAALMPFCDRATLAFCLEHKPREDLSWLSTWSVVGQSFRNCHQRMASLSDCEIKVDVLERQPGRGRFADNKVLAHLEEHWANPKHMGGVSTAESWSATAPQNPPPTPPEKGSAVRTPSASSAGSRGKGQARVGLEQETRPVSFPADSAEDSFTQLELGFEKTRAGEHARPSDAVRIVACANPEAEATFAARAIRHYVREEKEGRFRDVAVILRSLEGYHDVIRRVFARYEIPFFLDRREPVAYHPLAELTRYALRTVAFGWEHDDWFGALKTGLVHDDDEAIDRLENEALARGWRGRTWLEPIQIPAAPELAEGLEGLRRQIVPPFQIFSDAMAQRQRRPTGPQLSAALRALWQKLKVDRQLEHWNETGDHFALQGRHSALHSSVWEQMNAWLKNVELAFPAEALPLGDWMPIVEAGLGQLSVGVIPPALDQVLVGTIDRSRNPDLQLVLVLGLNEGVFPASPAPPMLLSQADRETLASHGATLGPDHHQQIGLERYYGYMACTRARKHLVLTCARRDTQDRSLNPSPFLDDLRRLFPELKMDEFSGRPDWQAAEHWSELIVPVLQSRDPVSSALGRATALAESIPALRPVVEKWQQVMAAGEAPKLSPDLAKKIYGVELRTSVTGLEDFAACPFKFFAGRGLRAEERVRFEVDPREKGSFQHEVLKEFHRRVREAKKNWRDLAIEEARALVRRVGEELLPAFRDGLFLADESRRFTARMLIEGLEKLMETLIRWTRQYQFDPTAVEVSFGLQESRLPAWRIDLDGRHALLLRGRIDRVDVCRVEETGETLGVVIDYKSSAHKLEPALLHHGLELQLLAYLGALSQSANLSEELGVARLLPAGGFYVSLKGGGGSARTRDAERDDRDKARRSAYQHRGRFDGGRLEKFDNRGQSRGDQFQFSKNSDGTFSRRGNEALATEEFHRLVARTSEFLREHGREIYQGKVTVAPYRWKGETACDLCAYRPVCRFDPWTQPYRVLRPPPRDEETDENEPEQEAKTTSDKTGAMK